MVGFTPGPIPPAARNNGGA
ncbi:uncharacterized protein G2W53_008871 [Senna tora]|uniref:Uncharacterized protein n=1 Tax=Senna tora TaxID=362788 RepID=A0A834WXH7_9FABA|nr:uncharacterized protein G2W53_008871 [Senna tora]